MLTLRHGHGRLLAALALGLAGIAAPAQAADCAGASQIPTPATLHTAAAAVTCLLDGERAARALPSLRARHALTRMGDAQAGDMVRRRFFSHVTPDGVGFADRLHRFGYDRKRAWHAGEALGWGTGSRATPEVLVREWLASPPHRRLLLNPDFRVLGVGVRTGVPISTRFALPGATYALELATGHAHT